MWQSENNAVKQEKRSLASTTPKHRECLRPTEGAKYKSNPSNHDTELMMRLPPIKVTSLFYGLNLQWFTWQKIYTGWNVFIFYSYDTPHIQMFLLI